MIISKPAPLKDGVYHRFSIETDGLIIDGFRVTKSLTFVLPPKAQYRGKDFPIVKLPPATEERILNILKTEYGELFNA